MILQLFKSYVSDRFHLLEEFLQFNGQANSSFDPNDGKRGCCHQVFLFTDVKLCRKLYYPKKELSFGKSLALLKCQFHFKQYMKIKRVYFGIKLYKLTSSNGTSFNSRKRMFHDGDELAYVHELVYDFMRNFLLNTSYCNKNQNRRRPASKNCVYLWLLPK